MPPQSALEAESAFYAAFERGDIDEMMGVWATTPEIICIHPMGAVAIGVAAVRASWAELLSLQLPRKFEIERIQVIPGPSFVLHVVHESITLPLQRQRFAPMAAVNGYREINGQWEMVLHHASPIAMLEEVTPDFGTPHSTRH